MLEADVAPLGAPGVAARVAAHGRGGSFHRLPVIANADADDSFERDDPTTTSTANRASLSVRQAQKEEQERSARPVSLARDGSAFPPL